MRGLIIRLHNKQESEGVEMPIPEIGRILLEPAVDRQEDSEDELLRVLTAVRSPCGKPTPPKPPTSGPAKNPTPSTKFGLYSKNTQSLLAKIAKSSRGKSATMN
jgi:hypothetical protein